jgi:hypothetical protein
VAHHLDAASFACISVHAILAGRSIIMRQSGFSDIA